jgi:hypothetical protein
MRSMKLLVAMAALAALVAGPVLAQEAATGGSMAPAAATSATDTTKAAPKHKHHGKKHHAKKTDAAAPATTAPATTAPAQ